MPIHDHLSTPRILLSFFLLQACVGNQAILPSLGAREQANASQKPAVGHPSQGSVLEVPWQEADNELSAVPRLLGGGAAQGTEAKSTSSASPSPPLPNVRQPARQKPSEPPAVHRPLERSTAQDTEAKSAGSSLSIPAHPSARLLAPRHPLPIPSYCNAVSLPAGTAVTGPSSSNSLMKLVGRGVKKLVQKAKKDANRHHATVLQNFEEQNDKFDVLSADIKSEIQAMGQEIRAYFSTKEDFERNFTALKESIEGPPLEKQIKSCLLRIMGERWYEERLHQTIRPRRPHSRPADDAEEKGKYNSKVLNASKAQPETQCKALAKDFISKEATERKQAEKMVKEDRYKYAHFVATEIMEQDGKIEDIQRLLETISFDKLVDLDNELSPLLLQLKCLNACANKGMGYEGLQRLNEQFKLASKLRKEAERALRNIRRDTEYHAHYQIVNEFAAISNISAVFSCLSKFYADYCCSRKRQTEKYRVAQEAATKALITMTEVVPERALGDVVKALLDISQKSLQEEVKHITNSFFTNKCSTHKLIKLFIKNPFLKGLICFISGRVVNKNIQLSTNKTLNVVRGCINLVEEGSSSRLEMHQEEANKLQTALENYRAKQDQSSSTE